MISQLEMSIVVKIPRSDDGHYHLSPLLDENKYPNLKEAYVQSIVSQTDPNLSLYCDNFELGQLPISFTKHLELCRKLAVANWPSLVTDKEKNILGQTEGASWEECTAYLELLQSVTPQVHFVRIVNSLPFMAKNSEDLLSVPEKAWCGLQIRRCELNFRMHTTNGKQSDEKPDYIEVIFNIV